jgi:hypothetical protein
MYLDEAGELAQELTSAVTGGVSLPMATRSPRAAAVISASSWSSAAFTDAREGSGSG